MLQNQAVIYIVGDTHNTKSLKTVLSRFDNIVSLGDIGAAVPKSIFFNNRLDRYRRTWKYFSNASASVDKIDIDWFTKLNSDGWREQINIISSSGKHFTLLMGNADLAMISFFPECKQYLESNISQQFTCVRKMTILTLNKIQIIFLPFQKEKYDLEMVRKHLDNSKMLFILAHCPAFERSRKEYYMHTYHVVQEVSLIYPHEIAYVHGHMHPSQSYRYSLSNLPSVTFYCPKAEENFDGFGINNHVVRVDTATGKCSFIDSITGEEKTFQDLPEKYLRNEDHWNEFEENGNNQHTKAHWVE